MSRFLLICLAFLVASCQSTPSRTWQLPPGVKAVPINGYDMAYVEQGQGIPVVLIHGSIIDYRSFRAQMEPFGAKYRAIAVTLRHYYPEPWNGQGSTFSERQHAADVAAFIKSLNAGPVHVLGHSRGGIIAALVAKQYPDTVRTLVLEEPGVFRMLGSADPSATVGLARTAKTLQWFDKGEIENGLQFFVDDTGGAGTWKARPASDRQITLDNAWTLKGEAADKKEPFDCADAGQIKVPVLLVGADRSPVVFGRVLDVLASCLKQSQRATIPNASHMMQRINPSAFNETVLGFLAQH
jgi:esterase